MHLSLSLYAFIAYLLVAFAGGIRFPHNVFGFDSSFPPNAALLSVILGAPFQDSQLLQPFFAELQKRSKNLPAFEQLEGTH